MRDACGVLDTGGAEVEREANAETGAGVGWDVEANAETGAACGVPNAEGVAVAVDPKALPPAEANAEPAGG